MLDIGGVLEIVSGTATAKATRATGDDLERESSLHLDGVSIANQPVGVTARGSSIPKRTTGGRWPSAVPGG